MTQDPTTDRADSAADQANRVFEEWCDFRHLSLANRHVIRTQCLTFFAMGVDWGRRHPTDPDSEDEDDLGSDDSVWLAGPHGSTQANLRDL
jgi:hypothetical protein